MKRRLLALLLSASIAGQPGAAGLPDLGEVGSGDLSPVLERRIGEQTMRQIRFQEASYLDDPEVEDYLNRLGRRLAGHAPSSAQDFTFFAISDRSLNAFALPGGFIGVHTGLIIAAQSESELASVLGHEIAHVTQRHIAQMVGNQGRTGLLVMASLILAVLAASRSPQAAEAAIATGSAAGIQSQLSFSRDFEREADRIGLQVLQSAGYDVRGMPSFFERLQRSTRLYENNAPVYMRTHPLTSERIADIENRSLQFPYRQVEDSLAFRLVRAKLLVDGVPAKDAPAQLVRVDDPAPVVRHYAQARALLRAGGLEEARAAAGRALALHGTEPMVVALVAEIEREAGRLPQAIERYRAGLAAAPRTPALLYGLAEARLAAGQAASAIEELRLALADRADDHRAWALMARAQAQAGSASGRHRAQAEVYRLQGALRAAVEQLELARRAGDADFYEASAIDSRLREMREQLRREREGQREAD